MMPASIDAPPTGSATFALLVSDVPGTLDRVFGLVRRQGCGVYSLALGPSGKPGVSRLTITLTGGHPQRLAPQLARLVTVLGVSVLRSSGTSTPRSTSIHGSAAATPAADAVTHTED